MGLLILGLGCTSDPGNFTKLTPDLFLVSEVLDFGGVVEDTVSEPLPLEISNIGDAPLHIADATFEGDGAWSHGDLPAEIAPGDTVELLITFAPKEIADYAGTLTFLADEAEDEAPAVVTLTGAGLPVPVPDITTDSTEIDCGDVEVGDQLPCLFFLSNVGDADLLLEDVVVTGSGAFELGTLPGTVMPGGQGTVPLTYIPLTPYGDRATFTFFSNDPDEPEYAVEVIGNGGGDGLYPEAIITGPTTAVPLETITLDGSQSHGPDEAELAAWEWTIATGASTGVLIPAGDGMSATMEFLAAGTYEVQLVVTDAYEVRSAPYVHEITVVPEHDVFVELVWDTELADLDLHLAQDGGPIFQTPADYAWCSDDADWGAAGADDDPVFLQDDESGFGPETLVIDAPAEGSYLARVHYYDDHDDGDVNATVNIWVRGVREASWTQVMSRNEVWDVATIQWSTDPSLTYVIEETSELYTAEHRTCYE